MNTVSIGALYHNSAIKPPTVLIYHTNFNDAAQRSVVASRWQLFFSEQLADLKTSSLVDDNSKQFYELLYLQEIMKYANLAAGGAVASSSGVTSAAVAPTVATSSGIKANLPDKYNGTTELDLFLDNMQTYYHVMNVPADKQAGVLRLNLSNAVNSTLTHTNNDPNFWDATDMIIAALHQLYTQPNKVEAAQTQLKTLKMQGYNLSKYFTKFVTLAGQAGFQPDEQPHKTSFYQGLNNLATRGGLRSQCMGIVHNNSKTLKDIYVEADKLMQNDHGINYNTKKCPADADEHYAAVRGTAYKQQQQQQQQSAASPETGGGWQTVRYKKHKQESGYDNNKYNKKQRTAGYNNNNINNKSLTCNRCERRGHAEESCNAQWHGKTNEPLPIATAAFSRSGLWKHDKYPEKKNKNTNHVTTSNITANTPSNIVDGANDTSMAELTEQVSSFGINTVNQSNDKFRSAHENYSSAVKPTPATQCK